MSLARQLQPSDAGFICRYHHFIQPVYSYSEGGNTCMKYNMKEHHCLQEPSLFSNAFCQITIISKRYETDK